MGASRACLLSERRLFPPVRVTLTEALGLNLTATAPQMCVCVCMCGFGAFIFWRLRLFFWWHRRIAVLGQGLGAHASSETQF